MATAAGSDGTPFHQRQSLALCAMHAVNTALQDSAAPYTKAQFDQICVTLAEGRSWFNPHRSWLGVGYYDVNVIMVALQARGLETEWFDGRKGARAVPDLTDEASDVVALILNRRYYSPWSLFLPKRHWFTIRRVEGVLYNLDSKLAAPEVRAPQPRRACPRRVAT